MSFCIISFSHQNLLIETLKTTKTYQKYLSPKINFQINQTSAKTKTKKPSIPAKFYRDRKLGGTTLFNKKPAKPIKFLRSKSQSKNSDRLLPIIYSLILYPLTPELRCTFIQNSKAGSKTFLLKSHTRRFLLCKHSRFVLSLFNVNFIFS